MKMKFHKMHGFGNDFLVVENYIELSKEQIKFLCDRNRGIGCDQLLFVDFPNGSLEMRTHNADGSEAKFCGNGARCLAGLGFILKKILPNQKFYIKNNEDHLESFIDENGLVVINLGKPKLYQRDVFDLSELFSEFELNSFLESNGSYINIGNPHIVFFVKNFDFNIENFGRTIQNNKFFKDGVNVNLARIIDGNSIELKTYERGAGLTNACGSGACATVFVAFKKGLVDPDSIKVQFSNEQDFLYASIENENIIMKGGFNYVFNGEIEVV